MRESASGLLIPDTIPPQKTYLCRICGTRFPEKQAELWVRHVRACDKQNPEYVEGDIASREANNFQSVQDKEQFEWLRKRAFERKELT